MTKSAICMASIVVLLNLVVGCTKTVELRIDENLKHPKTMVVGVVLNSGEEIIYDSLGGRYHSHVKSIVGRIADSARVVTKLSDTQAILVSDTTDADSTISKLSAKEFGRIGDRIADRRAELAGTSVKSVMMDDGRVVKFKDSQGTIDMHMRSIIGTNLANEAVSIPIAEAYLIKVKKQNKDVAWLIIGGVAVTAYMLYQSAREFQGEVKRATDDVIEIFGGD